MPSDPHTCRVCPKVIPRVVHSRSRDAIDDPGPVAVPSSPECGAFGKQLGGRGGRSPREPRRAPGGPALFFRRDRGSSDFGLRRGPFPQTDLPGLLAPLSRALAAFSSLFERTDLSARFRPPITQQSYNSPERANTCAAECCRTSAMREHAPLSRMVTLVRPPSAGGRANQPREPQEGHHGRDIHR
jgi:hypothetical protein